MFMAAEVEISAGSGGEGSDEEDQVRAYDL